MTPGASRIEWHAGNPPLAALAAPFDKGAVDLRKPAYNCPSIVSAPLTSNFPGASTFNFLTVPFSTSIE